MRLHFFSRLEMPSRFDFRNYYVLQNLKATQVICLVYFVLTVIIRLIIAFYKLHVQKISHMDEYDAANLISLIVLPVFYVGSRQMTKLFELDKKYVVYAKVFIFLFTLFVVANCMRASFYVMHNPRNTLVMYMLGLMVAGVFFYV